MKKHIIALILLAVEPSLCASTSLATTWHVEKDGTGDFTIIQAAMNLCAPGDTVLVGPGRYTYHAPFDRGAVTADT